MIKRLMYMTFLICLWLGGINIRTVISSAFITLFVTYIVLPFFYHYCSFLQRHLVFLSLVNYPYNINFNKPEDVGLPGTKNFYIQTETKVKVGVWHILPSSLIDQDTETDPDKRSDWFNDQLSEGRPVILYMHGNTSSRASSHRVELYDVFRNMDFHVIAFDYRGYADSSKAHLNENGVVHDAKVVYRSLKKLVGKSKLIVWGHSLGTGVSCHAMADMCLEGLSPAALILESPFNNIRDEIKYHPFTTFFRKMPKFEWLFLDPLKKCNIEFCSDEHLNNVDAPVLILHAEDDLVVPFMLGEKLFNSVVKSRPKSFPDVVFKSFEASLGYSHKYICRDAQLPIIIRTFLTETKAVVF